MLRAATTCACQGPGGECFHSVVRADEVFRPKQVIRLEAAAFKGDPSGINAVGAIIWEADDHAAFAIRHNHLVFQLQNVGGFWLSHKHPEVHTDLQTRASAWDWYLLRQV